MIVLIVRIVLALLLYAFLAAVLLAGLRELRQAVRAVPASHRRFGQIVVSAAPGDGAGLPGPATGATFPLLASTSFGRAATNDVCLPDQTVSSLHATLSLRGEHWVLEDAGSRNGTLLNGAPIDTPAVVTPEDTFQIGRVVFRLEPALGTKRL
ncbi:MAG: FHA domain-containing protein [Chloroflexi bacterium]|nr:FHA domain-containing protein [Chloroflexota bacterium]